MNVLEQIAEKEKGIADVEEMLTNVDMEDWERREYATLRKDYQTELAQLKAYVEENKSVFYPNK